MSANVAFPDSFNLYLPDHVHDLIPTDGPPRRVEPEEAKSGIDSAFYESVILLDDIIEILEAIADFDQALKLNPRLAATWANRALAMLMLGRAEEAEQNFSRFRDLGGRVKPAAEELLRELRGQGKSN